MKFCSPPVVFFFFFCTLWFDKPHEKILWLVVWMLMMHLHYWGDPLFFWRFFSTFLIPQLFLYLNILCIKNIQLQEILTMTFSFSTIHIFEIFTFVGHFFLEKQLKLQHFEILIKFTVLLSLSAVFSAHFSYSSPNFNCVSSLLI